MTDDPSTHDFDWLEPLEKHTLQREFSNLQRYVKILVAAHPEAQLSFLDGWEERFAVADSPNPDGLRIFFDHDEEEGCIRITSSLRGHRFEAKPFLNAHGEFRYRVTKGSHEEYECLRWQFVRKAIEPLLPASEKPKPLASSP